MEQHKIDRINELGRKAKAGTLTREEHEERQALHREYIDSYKRSLKHTLSRVMIVDENGNQIPLKRKGEETNGNKRSNFKGNDRGRKAD